MTKLLGVLSNSRVRAAFVSGLIVIVSPPSSFAAIWFERVDEKLKTQVVGYEAQDANGDNKKFHTIPRYLYHWVAPETLLRMVRAGYRGGAWPEFGKIEAGKSLLGTHYPATTNAPHGGLFTWVTPDTSTRGASYERYGEVLVRFEIDVDRAKVLLLKGKQSLVGKVDASLFDGPLPIGSTDLILHLSKMREWVILNPTIIKGFTADPNILKAELSEKIKALKDVSFWPHSTHFEPMLDPWDATLSLFNGEESARNYAVYRIERFINEGRAIIPKEFLQEGPSDLVALEKTIRDFRRSEIVAEIQDTVRLLHGKPNSRTALTFYVMRATLEDFDKNLSQRNWRSVAVEHEAYGKVDVLLETMPTQEILKEIESAPEFKEFSRAVLDLTRDFSELDELFKATLKSKPESLKLLRENLIPKKISDPVKACAAAFRSRREL